jgi:hypothetical protein
VVQLEKVFYGDRSFFKRYPTIDSVEKIRVLRARSNVYNPEHYPPSDRQTPYDQLPENQVGKTEHSEMLLDSPKRLNLKVTQLDVFRDTLPLPTKARFVRSTQIAHCDSQASTILNPTPIQPSTY